jgi:uncharacterized protein
MLDCESGDQGSNPGVNPIMNTKIETYSGRWFEPLNPNPADINIGDIAHALSNQCRFSGHTSRHYSVAEHSVHVSKKLPTGLMLFGLLHDASEAYLVDIPAPLKHTDAFRAYREHEQKLQDMIYTKYCGRVPTEREHLEIKAVDTRMRKNEQWCLMEQWPKQIDYSERFMLGLDVEQFKFTGVKQTFLNRFAELM